MAYTYHANGNMSSRLAPPRTIPWTSTNRPRGNEHLDLQGQYTQQDTACANCVVPRISGPRDTGIPDFADFIGLAALEEAVDRTQAQLENALNQAAAARQQNNIPQANYYTQQAIGALGS